MLSMVRFHPYDHLLGHYYLSVLERGAYTEHMLVSFCPIKLACFVKLLRSLILRVCRLDNVCIKFSVCCRGCRGSSL